jgi:hypothetical protein
MQYIQPTSFLQKVSGTKEPQPVAEFIVNTVYRLPKNESFTEYLKENNLVNRDPSKTADVMEFDLERRNGKTFLSICLALYELYDLMRREESGNILLFQANGTLEGLGSKEAMRLVEDLSREIPSLNDLTFSNSEISDRYRSIKFQTPPKDTRGIPDNAKLAIFDDVKSYYPAKYEKALTLLGKGTKVVSFFTSQDTRLVCKFPAYKLVSLDPRSDLLLEMERKLY